LWATARFDLGLSDEDFGKLNFALFHALLKRKQAADREEFLRAGIVAAAVINFSMGAPNTPVDPRDFVPKDPNEEDAFDLRGMTPEEQKQFVIDQFSHKKMR
jgi:hypothetical protein